nr:MAG TPA: hypothetical protein [Caudoviricetes sp.]
MGIDRAIWSVINCIRKILIRRSAGSFFEPALFLLAKRRQESDATLPNQGCSPAAMEKKGAV